MKIFLTAVSLIAVFFLSCNKQTQFPSEHIDVITEEKKINVADSATATIHLPGFPDFLIADNDAVWVSNIDRIDKLVVGSDTPVATVHLPVPCGAGAEGFGSLWVASCFNQSLYRIDKNSAVVTNVISTGLADPFGELSIATGAGAVWLLTDVSGILSRIDPNTNTVIKHITVKPHSYAAAFGFNAVWVSNSGTDYNQTGTVQRIDPATNHVAATITVGLAPHFIAAGENGVWVLNQGDGTVTRIDPSTNSITAVIHINAVGPGGDITTGAGSVWVRSNNALLIEIAPATNQVANVYKPAKGSGAVRVTASNVVWASAHDVKTVWAFQK